MCNIASRNKLHLATSQLIMQSTGKETMGTCILNSFLIQQHKKEKKIRHHEQKEKQSKHIIEIFYTKG